MQRFLITFDSSVSKEERASVDGAVSDACKAVGYMINGKTDQAMNMFHVKKQE